MGALKVSEQILREHRFINVDYRGNSLREKRTEQYLVMNDPNGFHCAAYTYLRPVAMSNDSLAEEAVQDTF